MSRFRKKQQKKRMIALRAVPHFPGKFGLRFCAKAVIAS